MSFKTTYSTDKKAVLEVRSAQDNSVKVELPAFLSSFTDSFASSWSEEQVYGRIDPIGTFQGTKRSIQIGIDIIGYDIADAKSNLKKINTLTKMLYPSYAEVAQEKGPNALLLSKSPLVEIKFGNLIQDQAGDANFLLGWFTSFSANPVLEMGMFTDKAGEFLPKVHNVSMSFTPQHRGDLGFSKTNVGKAKFPYDGGS